MFALVDCNNFYASCERVFNPAIRNRPVIVLSNNDGCVIARSNQAKAIGFKMGDPFFKVRNLVEQNGVAVFSTLTIDQAGSGYKLSASSTGLSGVTTTAFGVTPIAASQLVISTQPPTSLTAGTPFNMTVTAEDPFGNVATSFSGSVGLGLSSNPGSGSLGGILTATASQGRRGRTDGFSGEGGG